MRVAPVELDQVDLDQLMDDGDTIWCEGCEDAVATWRVVARSLWCRCGKEFHETFLCDRCLMKWRHMERTGVLLARWAVIILRVEPLGGG